MNRFIIGTLCAFAFSFTSCISVKIQNCYNCGYDISSHSEHRNHYNGVRAEYNYSTRDTNIYISTTQYNPQTGYYESVYVLDTTARKK